MADSTGTGVAASSAPLILWLTHPLHPASFWLTLASASNAEARTEPARINVPRRLAAIVSHRRPPSTSIEHMSRAVLSSDTGQLLALAQLARSHSHN